MKNHRSLGLKMLICLLMVASMNGSHVFGQQKDATEMLHTLRTTAFKQWKMYYDEVKNTPISFNYHIRSEGCDLRNAPF